jgi:hypothetical protein
VTFGGEIRCSDAVRGSGSKIVEFCRIGRNEVGSERGRWPTHCESADTDEPDLPNENGLHRLRRPCRTRD